MPEYLLRNIPDDLWRKVKAAAALDGLTIREALLKLLAKYAAT